MCNGLKTNDLYNKINQTLANNEKQCYICANVFGMEIIYRNLNDIKLLDENPRKISTEMMEKLKQSIKNNRDYFEARPLILSDRTGELVVIAGNQRYKACVELGINEVPTALLSGLTEEREREIIIRDNVNNGEWDEELLKAWDAEELKDWGVDMPDSEEEREKKETEKLSELKFDTVYYTPELIQDIKLLDCIDFKKFDKKIEAIEKSCLSDEQKAVMKWFAYRFIRIDFESVANYYAFAATEEEKAVMERLRLVFVDGSIDGFIEDDLIRINEVGLNI